jgi:hypothetical protein
LDVLAFEIAENLGLIGRTGSSDLWHKFEHRIEARASQPGRGTQRVSFNETGHDLSAFFVGQLIHVGRLFHYACAGKHLVK